MNLYKLCDITYDHYTINIKYIHDGNSDCALIVITIIK